MSDAKAVKILQTIHDVQEATNDSEKGALLSVFLSSASFSSRSFREPRSAHSIMRKVSQQVVPGQPSCDLIRFEITS